MAGSDKQACESWPIGRMLSWRPQVRNGLATILALAILVGCGPEQPAFPMQTVAPDDLKVIDGDTVFWRGERVRLQGFDTPEIFSPGCAAELQKGQAARRTLEGMITNARTAGFIMSPERDRYGRSLAVLMLDGADVGTRLVGAGLARPYHAGRRSSWCGA